MTSENEDIDADAILAELEAENENSTTTSEHQQTTFPGGKSSHGGRSGVLSTSNRQDIYTTLNSDDDTLQFTTEHERAIVHFFHPDFARCMIMDEHLSRIAQSHGIYGGSEASGEEIALGKINVNNAPFVVERLGVRVLPCVIGFSKGIVKGKVIGFEGICWDGKEKAFRVSEALEEAFVKWGVLRNRLLRDEGTSDEEDQEDEKTNSKYLRRGIRGPKRDAADEDDDWD